MKTKIQDLYHARVAGVCTVLFMALLVTSCDVIDAPFEETPDNPDTVGVRQTVLLEDVTGQYCGNCPAGNEVIRQLEASYGDRLIVISIHAGNLALPVPPDYPAEYRTPEGNVLNGTFKNSLIGLPNGQVNRVTVNDGIVLFKDRWPEVIAGELMRKPDVDLKVVRSYDSATRTVTLDVDVKYLVPGTADDKIVAMITESKIIGDQLDYRKTPNHVDNYEFNNVLRTSFNGAWGDSLSTSAIAKGTTITKRLTYTVPSEKTWTLDNCDVVVYVHRHNADLRILQARKVSLTGQ